MQQNISLHNDIAEVPLLGEWVEQLGETLGLGMPQVFQLNLALEEAVVNVMNYAYPGQENMPVRLSAEGDAHQITFVLEDEGIPYDPLAKEDPDTTLSAEERPIGGLGIFLIKQLMHDVQYERVGQTNRLTMLYEA